MALDSAELVAYAREAALRGDDLYSLLSVDATTPKEDIHRAWRKAGLKYHPDKAGANYDADKYESFERARDVLVDPAAREAYDNSLRAKLEKKRKMDEMSSDRRRFVEELERAERDAKRSKTEARDGLGAEERKRAAEAGRRRMEERARLMREAEERSRMRERSREVSEPAAAAAAAAPSPAPAAPAAAATQPAPVKETAREANGTAPEAPSESKDEFDEREAEIMRRLQEKRERKAAKKSRKSDVSGLSSKGWEGTTSTPIKPPPPDHTGESKADGHKAALPSRPSFLKDYAASAPTSPAGGNKQSSSGSASNFSATMARLKAAQMKREEEKRKREAEAAGGEQQAV